MEQVGKHRGCSTRTNEPLGFERLDPSLAKPDEVEVLEDLVVAAVNDARQRVDAMVAEEMSKLTGGLQLPPGMKLPF